jgi:hypothetical protein
LELSLVSFLGFSGEIGQEKESRYAGTSGCAPRQWPYGIY